MPLWPTTTTSPYIHVLYNRATFADKIYETGKLKIIECLKEMGIIFL